MGFYEYCMEKCPQLNWDLAQMNKEEKEAFERYIEISSDIVRGINPHTRKRQYLRFSQCDKENKITGMLHKTGEKLMQGYNMYEENIEIVEGYIDKRTVKKLHKMILDDISFRVLSIQPIEN